MYGLVCVILFFALAFWGTFITHKSQMHRIQNKIKHKNHKYYMRKLTKLKEIYGKDKPNTEADKT